MMPARHVMVSLLIAVLAGVAAAAPEPQGALTATAGVEPATAKAARMQWFADAKFGVFVHWGIYAVDGVDESWSFFNGKLSHAEYMRQLTGFTASNYDPKAWADLIRASGARYAVLTSRHHDGVALWDSKQGINVVRNTPARRDLIAPFVDALRADGLKVGMYYSLPDWSYADYDVFTRKQKRYDIGNEPARWQRYQQYFQQQLADLQQRYQPDLFWFDGDWEHSAEQWQSAKVRSDLLARNPQVIINSRLNQYGDYATPEHGLPIVMPDAPYWELCITMNKSWGYQPRDTEYKSTHQLIQILSQTIAMGGNLLLDMGPRADGSIDPQQVERLRGIGRWTTRNAEAIYASKAGLPLDHYAGPSTLSKDGRTLYLFVDGKPAGDLLVKGLDNKVLRARVLGSKQPAQAKVLGKFDWSKYPGLLFVSIPEQALDQNMTVVALELDSPVKLYREESKPIESNG